MLSLRCVYTAEFTCHVRMLYQSSRFIITADLKDEDEKYTENLIDLGDEVPGKSKRRPETWTEDEVCQMIVEIGLPQYEENFRKNHIDGQELVNLDQHSLEKALGIGKGICLLTFLSSCNLDLNKITPNFQVRIRLVLKIRGYIV